MMRILLSNDDGVHATGLMAMYKELKKIGDVSVVAPLQEKSTTGHSLTLHKPLRMHKFDTGFYGVSGSPADCIYLGVQEVMKEKPDLVVSGINRGANLGQDIFYSGTVSAAREASILGVPALAVSLATQFIPGSSDDDLNFKAAAKIALKIIKQIKKYPTPKYTLLNLNVPDLPYAKIKGVKIAHQGFRYYSGNILRRKDHRDKLYYWVGGQYKGFRQDDEDSDCSAVDRGFASLTPIQLDTTDYACLNQWSLFK